MGSSQSFDQIAEDHEEQSQHDNGSGLDEVSSSDGARHREISPVVSETDESEEAESSDLPHLVIPDDSSRFNMSETEQDTTTFTFGTNDGERNFTSDGPPQLGGIAWQQAAAEESPEHCLEDMAEATCSFLSSEMTGAILGEEWSSDRQVLTEDASFFPWTSTSTMIAQQDVNQRRLSDGPFTTDNDGHLFDFYPPVSDNYEWMGRSIETLLLGHRARAPVLALPEVDCVEQSSADETDCLPESRCHRRISVCSLNPHKSPHLAARRISHRRKRTRTSVPREDATNAGPNVLLSLLAREGNGKPSSFQNVPPIRRLRKMGGSSLLNAVDEPAAGIVAEVEHLGDAIDRGDWTETQVIISRLLPRFVSDPNADRAQSNIDDPSLPASASRFHAGGGRLGLERDAFVSAGGVKQLVRVFSEPAFVGDEVRQSNDARDLSDEIVKRKLSGCWNEIFASLREIVYSLPIVVENGDVLDNGDFLPFLFTVLVHDSCFDGAAVLIEEILSVQANSMQQVRASSNLSENAADEDGDQRETRTYVAPPSTFFLGNVPDLYELLAGFNCRQLAHFCRILALLIFEPDDRSVFESPTSLRSCDLLQLRRDRPARAARDATVDMNQSIMIGDAQLLERLVTLLRVMNYGPPLKKSNPYHIMAHCQFIAPTLAMVGLDEINDFREVDRLDSMARWRMSRERSHPSDLGAITEMLDDLADSLRPESLQETSQIGHIINIISAATRAGMVVGTPSQSRTGRSRGERNDRSQDPTVTVHPSVASAAATVTDPVVRQSLESMAGSNSQGEEAQVISVTIEGNFGGPASSSSQRDSVLGYSRSRINTPEDAANVLQLNAFMLAPFHVEVLFVLCTLLQGRRKIDAQNMIRIELVPTLNELFDRMSFSGSDRDDSTSSEEEPTGIHGPGCECTPESAITIQFLRLLHNFCDRDCCNHSDRRLLLSRTERDLLFSSNVESLLSSPSDLQPGLLSKLIQAFMSEPDDSPHRFWLASCVESYLRGSCPQEQFFAAQSGLLSYLVEHVSSERIHCASSLQVSFDLLGEMCKGNIEVLRFLMSNLDETGFRSLMNAAASNLVDSNVFIRSLILSIEKYERDESSFVFDMISGDCNVGRSNRFYLTHSWWDPVAYDIDSYTVISKVGQQCDDSRPSDWFPPFPKSPASATLSYSSELLSSETIVSRQWAFPPFVHERGSVDVLARFLDINRPQLLRRLLQVVDLECINHENICCLNTAIILLIFARRRGELIYLVENLKRLVRHGSKDSLVDRMQSLAIDPAYDHPASDGHDASVSSQEVDVVRRFRELLWFWNEYYTHRGRDRISIEFSSRLHFTEWQNVVSILTKDDGSSRSSLTSKPIRLPRSPYERAPRAIDVVDSYARGD